MPGPDMALLVVVQNAMGNIVQPLWLQKGNSAASTVYGYWICNVCCCTVTLVQRPHLPPHAVACAGGCPAVCSLLDVTCWFVWDVQVCMGTICMCILEDSTECSLKR